MDPLPKATVRPSVGEWIGLYVRPKHAVCAFAMLSVGGIFPELINLTLYFPPLGIVFDVLWLTPLVLPFAIKRMRTFSALACFLAFVGQAFLFDLTEAIPRIFELHFAEVIITIGIVGGLIAGLVNLVKQDPDPDFVPNEFTIR